MDLTTLLTIFTLSVFVGYFVVWGVTPALHTPLMAVTNAISGIVVVAAILVAGAPFLDSSLCNALACPNPTATTGLQTTAKILGFLAITLCSINIFGGFTITRRMLAMFRSKTSPEQKHDSHLTRAVRFLLTHPLGLLKKAHFKK